MNTTYKVNNALIVFNDSSLRKVIFSFLKNHNILYAPETLYLSETYWDSELKPQTFGNHTVKYKIYKNLDMHYQDHCFFKNNTFTLINPDGKFFEEQAKKQKKAIMKPFNSYTPGGKLKKHQRAKIMRLVNHGWVTYASIINIKNEKYLQVWYFTKYEAMHKLKKYTTKLDI